jgi:hypothetical protein
VVARERSPRELVAAACTKYGRSEVVARCIDMTRGRGVDPAFLTDLVGVAARTVLGGQAGGLDGYWPRVWGLRAMLYAYEPTAETAVVAATHDASWRVREMAAKVTRQHGVDAALDEMIRLIRDEVPRVRAAAERALRALSA